MARFGLNDVPTVEVYRDRQWIVINEADLKPGDRQRAYRPDDPVEESEPVAVEPETAIPEQFADFKRSDVAKLPKSALVNAMEVLGMAEMPGATNTQLREAINARLGI